MCGFGSEMNLSEPGSNALGVNLKDMAIEFLQGSSEHASEENKARFNADFARAMTILLHQDAVAANLHEFVLSVDPQQDVALLTNPETLRYAYTLSVSDSMINMSGGKYGMLFDSEMTIDLMLIPCRMQGVMSYGIVGRRLYGSHASCTHNRHIVLHDIGLGRFIRNEETGEFLVFIHAENENMDLPGVNMLYIRNENSRERLQMKTYFEKEAFSVGDFAGAVRRHITGVQTRFCPMCNSSPKRPCSCVLPFRRPLHATDFSSFMSNTEFMKGDFLGDFEFLINCPMVGAFAATRVMSRASCKTPLNPSIPFCLHSKILQSRLTIASPTRSVMPSQYEALLPLPGPLDILGARSDPLLSSFMGSMDNMDTVSLWNALSEEPVVVSLPEDDVQAPLLGMDLTTSLDKASSPLSSDENEVDPPLPQQDLLGYGSTSLPQQVCETSPAVDLSFLPNGDELILATDSLSTVGDMDIGVDLVDSPIVKNDCCPFDTVETLSSSVSSSSDRLKEFAAAAAASPSEPEGDGEHQLTSEELAIEAKKELRKQKNRAAAARSNAVRKVRNETLRRDLTHVRERVQVLRAAEAVLREENETLKERVTALSLS